MEAEIEANKIIRNIKIYFLSDKDICLDNKYINLYKEMVNILTYKLTDVFMSVDGGSSIYLNTDFIVENTHHILFGTDNKKYLNNEQVNLIVKIFEYVLKNNRDVWTYKPIATL